MPPGGGQEIEKGACHEIQSFKNQSRIMDHLFRDLCAVCADAGGAMRKQMRKALTLVMVFLILSSVPACSDKGITEGDVYKKQFKPEYETIMYVPTTFYNGKTSTTVLIPYFFHYPDRYVISIKNRSDDLKEPVTRDFYVDKNTYDSIQIGSYFVFDDAKSSTEEPYTKQRKKG